MKHLKYILILIVSFISLNGTAQTISASATLDTDYIKLGEQTILNLKVTYPKGNKISFPVLKDTVTGKIDIVKLLKTDTAKLNEEFESITKKYLITAFDNGNWVIPPFKLYNNNDSSKVIETEALLLNVQTVAVDTTKAIKPIKSPYDAPITFRELIPYIAGGLLAILIISLIAWYIIKRRKNKPQEVIIEQPKISGYEKAYNRLKEIEAQKLWQEGLIKEYYSAISDTLRIYVEDEFKINAPELTTDQTRRRLRHVMSIDNTIKAKLIQVLELADMVKFAKENPIQPEHELSMSNAYTFLNDCHNALTNPPKENNE